MPKIIPIVDARAVRAATDADVALASARARVGDTRARHLRDLRISVTDKCNFRCTYCMPKEVFGPGYKFLPQTELLSFEEIVRMARLGKQVGVEKIRITGGEPLLRRDLPKLVEMLAALGGLELTLTTNGALLAKHAHALKTAGLHRITVSLDSLDDVVFRAMNDMDFPVDDVLAGIDAASVAGFDAIKVNMVVQRGVNDQGIVDFAKHFKGSGHIARFIEYMDVGSTNGWRMDEVLPSAEVVKRINDWSPLVSAQANYEGEVAERWRYADGKGEIGVISSVTHAFCHTCTRARLSTDGKLYTCLFAERGIDFRAMLRAGARDEELLALLVGGWQTRDDHYSEIRTQETAKARKVEMSYIGG